MKITLLPSDKGDCLLLTSKKGKTILADGGTKGSYQDHVRPFLGAMMASGTKKLDLVYVSHTDDDHIAGILQLMDDIVAWRVFEHLQGDGAKKPGFPRPPTPAAIWHNAFHEQVGENAGAIESQLAAAAATLSNSTSASVRNLATEYREIAASIPQAIRLSRRVSAEQLGIPLNKPWKGKLAMMRPDMKAFSLGGFKVRVIGPFKEDLEKYRSDWNKWLKVTENKQQLEKIRREAEEDEDQLGMSAPTVLATDAEGLGDRGKVTVPNLASLMLLVEEGKRRVLMTGDGHAEDILRGLGQHQMLRSDGGGHFDVLKVQHHGSEHNLDRGFAKKITADHYIFCGNGKHANPDTRVISVIAESRLGTGDKVSKNPEAGSPFKFWFSADSKTEDGDRAHMAKITKLVQTFANKSGGRMSFEFLRDKPIELQLA